MNGNEYWIWFVVGLLPYYIKRAHPTRRTYTLEIRALFWSLAVQRRPRGRYEWTVRIPLIERLRDAVWAAMARLRDNNLPQTEAEQSAQDGPISPA